MPPPEQDLREATASLYKNIINPNVYSVKDIEYKAYVRQAARNVDQKKRMNIAHMPGILNSSLEKR